MRELEIRVPADGGALVGHRGGEGPPALLLHGGPSVPDYMGACAVLLGDAFELVRYTQRGVPPSATAPPYTIESHAADAVRVLDALGIERAWAIGHSWGGHLALHLLASNAERLLGVICIDPLGAYGEVFGEFGANVRRKLTDDEAERVDAIELRRRAGEVTEPELLERFRLLWPLYFADPATAAPLPGDHIGVEASTETNRSIATHHEAQTLVRALPRAPSRPALFVHGALDPLPVRSSSDTAKLIPGAELVVIDECGHFPWLEQPDALHAAIAEFMRPLTLTNTLRVS